MQGRRRDKGEDKPVADAHREYLDEEFSDEDEAPEEKRERRGRRAQDDQFSENLLRATYAEKELDKLVNYVKDFTTLSGLSDDHWHEDCLSAIREFVTNMSATILTLFFSGETLTAQLSFPDEPVHELIYFSKKLNQPFHPDDFPDQILFGTINDNVELSILTLVRDVIFPIAEKITTWSDSVKEDFCSSVEKFLCNLTDLTYKMLGLSVIYQPREDSELTAEKANFDKKLVKRLEHIVVHWTRQIRIALGDQEQSNAGELLSFKDEYDFWIYRYENLSALRQQLEMNEARRVMKMLDAAGSGQVRRIQALTEEMKQAIREAQSNLRLLSVLKEPCANLEGQSHLLELLPRLPKLLQLCRFVWLNSVYFGRPEHVGRLFELLGNQIIGLCRAFIPLDELFTGRTSRIVELLVDSIGLCRYYQRLYAQISRAHNKLTHHEWQLNADQVFQYIDAFVVRCHNLIEISQAIIDFARMDETGTAPAMKFSGSKGPEYEKAWRKIEERFGESLSWLQRVSWKILNVRQSTWYDDMSKFRGELRKLEVAVENTMDRALKQAGNAEEAVRVVHGFRHLAHRETLQRQLEDKRTKVRQLFEDEIEATKREMTSERAEYPALGPYFGGRALALRLKASRLVDMEQLLREQGLDEKTRHHCQVLLASLDTRSAELYRGWQVKLGDNPQNQLDRHLMRRHGQPIWGDLQCNIQPRLLNLCEEASYWLDLRFELPVNVQQIIARWSSLHFIYENVFAIVRAYNNIVQALSDEEKLLFRELIRELDNKIKPGLIKLTWNSDYIEDYIKDCNARTANLQEFVDTYKKCNADILKICFSICDTSMIRIRSQYVYHLDELLEEMQAIRQGTVEMYISKFNEIVQYLLVVYEGFQHVIEDSLNQWKLYLAKFDNLLRKSFKIAIKNSLSDFYKVLHGDGTTSPISIIHLKADLIDNKINFRPALADVGRMISEILYRLIDSLKAVPRIVEKFQLHDLETKPFWKEYMEDNDLDRSQQMLNNEVSYCFTQVQNYLTTWEPFADTWEVNKDLFIQRYEKLKPTVALFDADIVRYAELANNVQMQETVVAVHFLEINAERLKAEIDEQCRLWQLKLTELLLRLTESQVHHIHKYVANNGKRITKEPTDLISMQAALQLFERLTTEIPQEEKEIPKIRQQYEALEKYEIPMTLELKRNIRDIDEHWTSYLKLLTSWKLILMEKKEELKRKLIEEDELIKNNIISMLTQFSANAPFTAQFSTKSASNWLRNFRKQVNAAKTKLNKLKKDLTIFNISQLELEELNTLLKDLSAIELVWELTEQWDKAWEHYKAGNFWSIEIEDMEEMANVLFRKLTRLSRELKEKHWSIVDATRSRVDKFRRTLPLITDLKNPSMRNRHWRKVMQTIGRDFDPNSNEFTLNLIAEMQMHSFAEEIADISNSATMELAIETGLTNIAEVWKVMPILLLPYKDKGVFRLATVDDITQALEEHQVQLSAMKSTKYVAILFAAASKQFVEAFAVEVDYWEQALSSVGEILEMVLSVQKGYMYLDNIFDAEDIRQQLPRETNEFDQLTISWRDITSCMASAASALDATHKPPGLLNTLNKLNNKLEAIQRALEQYLETKRHVFPRFYFISNDDLLEILANSKKPELVQPHIKKLFENIKHVKLGRSASSKPVAEGMFSSEGEYVEFIQPIILEGQVEVWLCFIESAMRECLREVLRQCRASLRKMSAKRDKWVKEWQSQPGITSTQIQWTSDCTRILLQCKVREKMKVEMLHARASEEEKRNTSREEKVTMKE